MTLSINAVYLSEMEIEKMIAQAEKLSLDYNGEKPNKTTKRYGCYRTTAINGGFAFKLSMNKGGIDCNRSEWDFYAMTTDKVRELLAKPRYISRNGKVIVSDCLTMREDLGFTHDFDIEVKRARAILKATVHEAHGIEIWDLHGGNFGRDDGTNTIACTDYGALALLGTIAGEDDGPFYNRDKLHQLISK